MKLGKTSSLANTSTYKAGDYKSKIVQNECFKNLKFFNWFRHITSLRYHLREKICYQIYVDSYGTKSPYHFIYATKYITRQHQKWSLTKMRDKSRRKTNMFSILLFGSYILRCKLYFWMINLKNFINERTL